MIEVLAERNPFELAAQWCSTFLDTLLIKLRRSRRQRAKEQLFKQLSGSGLELGALHRPASVPHLNVTYVDRCTKAELLKQYPELENQKIIEPDLIDDAETLATIPDQSQDFLIASHIIEHLSNPIRAFENWNRVLRPGGKLFLAVPNKNVTFDRRRKKTPLTHLIEDYENPSEERDKKHFEEFALHVSADVFKTVPREKYKEYSEELWKMQYSIHYHVWDYASFRRFLEFLSSYLPGWELEIEAEVLHLTEEFVFLLSRRPSS